MDRREEVETKLERVRAYLGARGLGGALFASHGNFAWATAGGQNHVNIATERGVGGADQAESCVGGAGYPSSQQASALLVDGREHGRSSM